MTMKTPIDLSLFCPISRIPIRLRDLLRESQDKNAPVVITKKGYPTAVVLTVEQYQEITGTHIEPRPPSF